MTTGFSESDHTQNITNGKKGLIFRKVWDGGDRDSLSRPIRPATVPGFHQYASDVNLLSVPHGRRIPYIKGAYDQWRTARDAYFRQLKEYHTQKAEWIKRSKSEMHPYDLTLTSVDHGSGTYFNRLAPEWGVSGEVSLSGTFGWQDAVPPWDSIDEIALIGKIKEKLDGGIGFHLGIAAAEADKTLSMIGSNAKRFRRIGESLAHGDYNKAFRVSMNGSSAHYIKGFKGLRGVSDNYLMYQFGIVPLLHDVIDGARSYGYKAGRPKLIRVFARRKTEISGVGPSTGYWQQPYHSSMAKIIVSYILTDSVVDESGILDFPSTLWERLPYSFVVDWWFNIGAYLNALHVARAVNGSTFCRTSSRRMYSGPISSGNVYTITGHGGSSFSLRQVREVVNTLAVPPPTAKPLFHKDKDVRLRHTLEAIALVVQKGPLLRKGFLSLREKIKEYYP